MTIEQSQEKAQVNAVIERLEHAIQSLKDLCGMIKVNEDKTCATCRKWLEYPKEKDKGCGVCIEPMNGCSGKFVGGLVNIKAQCPNRSPLTWHYIGCEYWERKEGTK